MVIVLAFLLTKGVAQAVTPFIRQDDWPFLLPAGTTGVLPTSYYNVSEGRWLNSACGRHRPARHPHDRGADLRDRLRRARSGHVARAPPASGRASRSTRCSASRLFASCVWVQLLYWPGTLAPSVLMAAAAVWLLLWVAPAGAARAVARPR